jgi:glycosyltransferase involved in cell wall biosynthesis
VRILFVHSNYPAQFRHLSQHYAASGEHEVVFLSQGKEWTAPSDGSVKLQRYQLGRDPQGALCHPYLKRFESAVLTGQACLREAMKLRQGGFTPDLIVGHSGFGSTLYLKEVWPEARFLGYFEWYYRTNGSDVGFGEKDPVSPDTACRVHTYNAPIVMDLGLSDRALCPTRWQAQQFPEFLQERLDVIFDGINTELFRPLTPAERQPGLTLGDLHIPSDVPLVTYTTRGFEPYRGWPQVAEGLSLLMKRNAQVRVLLVGSDEVAYGAARGDGRSWRQWALDSFEFDPSRLHWLPPLQYDDYRKVLQHSWVHVYWTIPFILSWGLMESLSTGCAVVASDTPPVQEVISAGKQGLLVDFFDPESLAARVDELLADPQRRLALGKKARQTILKRGYDLESCLKQQLQLVDALMA